MPTNTAKVVGTAGGAAVGGGAGVVGAGLLTKGLAAAATATSSFTPALLTFVPIFLPLAGVLLGGLGAYAVLKD